MKNSTYWCVNGLISNPSILVKFIEDLENFLPRKLLSYNDLSSFIPIHLVVLVKSVGLFLISSNLTP